MEKKVWTEPKPMCEKLQYLIGVPSQYIDNYDTLNKGVMIEVRKLCSLRSMIIANFTGEMLILTFDLLIVGTTMLISAKIAYH